MASRRVIRPVLCHASGAYGSSTAGLRGNPAALSRWALSRSITTTFQREAFQRQKPLHSRGLAASARGMPSTTTSASTNQKSPGTFARSAPPSSFQMPLPRVPLTPAPTEGASAAVKTADSENPQSVPRAAAAKAPQASEYDVIIVGGGVTGTALLYELAAFTDVKSVCLLEKRHDFAQVSSGPQNNSQTIHCGDIETNYSLEKARKVKRQADLLRNYGGNLPEGVRGKCVFKMPKMVLGVGPEECAQIEARYAQFKELYPGMKLLDKQQIREREPSVVRVNAYTERAEDLRAIAIDTELTAVNYFTLSHSFVQQAQDQAAASKNRKVDCLTSTEVKEIRRRGDGTFDVFTNRGFAKARFVVVAACGYSVLMAQRMGYGLGYSVLPVAGSFYFSKKRVLNGKVYTIQDPKLPFAAVHGDPDVACGLKTRFGPTALPMPFLERYNWGSVKDFFKVVKPDMALMSTYWKMFNEKHMRRYALLNLAYEAPKLGTYLFSREVKKIIPGLSADDLEYAHGYGGVRPQLVSKKDKKLLLGEGKIDGGNILFNVTPSPGGTTCLGNGEADMRRICAHLGASVNETKFRSTLMEGEYPVPPLN